MRDLKQLANDPRLCDVEGGTFHDFGALLPAFLLSWPRPSRLLPHSKRNVRGPVLSRSYHFMQPSVLA